MTVGVAALLGGCDPLPPPLVTEAQADSIYELISHLTGREYLDTLQRQLPVNPIPGWSTDTVSLADVWPVFEYGYTTTDLNMRRGPSTDFEVLSVIPKGGRVVFTFPVGDRPRGVAQPSDIVRDMLYEADPNWSFLWKRPLEDTREGAWLRVQHGRQVGWVHSGYFRLPTRSELKLSREEGVRAGIQDRSESARPPSLWLWILVCLPIAVAADLALYFVYGERRLYMSGGDGVRWRTLAGVLGPGLVYVMDAAQRLDLPESQWAGYLLAAVVITVAAGIPANLLSEAIISRRYWTPLFWRN